MRLQTKKYHQQSLETSRGYFIRKGFNEITNGVFRDCDRNVDFYPSKKTCYFYKEKRYEYYGYKEELLKSGFNKKTAEKLATA